MDALYLVGIAVLAVFGFVFAIVLFNFFGIWLRARIANAPVGMGKMIGMRLRRVPVGLIVDNRITAVKAGIEVPSDPLEAHYLAGGDVTQVILALIAADKAGISLDFNRACAIDLADSYKDVLEHPDRISKAVLGKGLDSNTAFEILSIDIADVDVGDNIGAKLQSEQADADKRIAQAKAEVRRAAAVAVEQEMKAKTQEMRAKVVEAEAQVPMAMAEAFRAGHLGIMDYYRMKNVQADTSMRESIAGTDKPRTEAS